MSNGFPDDINESKAINISLATAIFVIILLTFIEGISLLIRTYVIEFSILFEKAAIMLVFVLVLSAITKYQELLIKWEIMLSRIKRRKKIKV